ncbi:MAG: hypothetical protein Q3972_04470 [Corynebacterium sp.]|nr:hypothetical protein [Corynebacterium sp.]
MRRFAISTLAAATLGVALLHPGAASAAIPQSEFAAVHISPGSPVSPFQQFVMGINDFNTLSSQSGLGSPLTGIYNFFYSILLLTAP